MKEKDHISVQFVGKDLQKIMCFFSFSMFCDLYEKWRLEGAKALGRKIKVGSLKTNNANLDVSSSALTRGEL